MDNVIIFCKILSFPTFYSGRNLNDPMIHPCASGETERELCTIPGKAILHKMRSFVLKTSGLRHVFCYII